MNLPHPLGKIHTVIERLSRHKIEIGDILYSRRGDVGRCAFATEKEAGWLCGTGKPFLIQPLGCFFHQLELLLVGFNEVVVSRENVYNTVLGIK